MEPLSFFDTEERDLVQKFMVNSLKARAISRGLLKSLTERCIISDTTTLFELTNGEQYVVFMQALLKQLSCNLSVEVEDSQWGIGKISDFDVYHSFMSERSRTLYLKENPTAGRSLSGENIVQLGKNALAVKRWLVKQRMALISHWDLPDGDMPVKAKSVKRTVPTPASVANEAEEKITEVAHEQALVQYNQLVGGKNPL
jgi:hypothetical protein